ncbi:hypothetical protein INT48_001905 [Thamnidium elegans]|uniref:Histone chaperone domain-containing protein n=1 Tax=Thamnidium elegans TaxID=101142 RepID=A0A8H7SHL4_9FUNG|nr:hypothetical protein INT48_001905 [Thamnidium elegans]
MSDRRSKLMALAGKRKQATQDPTSSDDEKLSNLSDDDELVVKQKRSIKPKSKIVKKTQGSDDEGSDEGKDGISEDELQVLDTKLIIPGGRRTRGKKIDYKQFGADPEGEE